MYIGKYYCYYCY